MLDRTTYIRLYIPSCLYRDLAARNCLLASNNVVKVGDFGFSRLLREEMYKARQRTELAIKWTAPEALKFVEFTVKSDVWCKVSLFIISQ